MSSLDSVLYRQAAAKGRTIFVGDDTNHASNCSVAIRLRYIGTGTVTSVTVTTGTGIVMVTSDGGTDSYTWATNDTVAKAIAAINADGIFEARALDTLLSSPTDDEFTDGAITSHVIAEGTRVWDVTVDNSTALYMAACLDPKDRGFLAPKGHRVELVGYEYVINMNAAAADSEQVWIRKNDGTEEQIIGRLSIDTTLTQRTFASGNATYFADPDTAVIVKVLDAGTLADAAGNYIQVDGRIV